MDNVIYLFKNTRAVVKAQKAIIRASLKCLIIPVPRDISSECGMCIETDIKNEEYIDKILIEENISINKCKDYKNY